MNRRAKMWTYRAVLVMGVALVGLLVYRAVRPSPAQRDYDPHASEIGWADNAAAIQRANDRADADREPIRQAIASHSLIRGMTITDAHAALGAPYSVTDAGSIQTMTWRVGKDYWSASFSNGVATAVSVTRL